MSYEKQRMSDLIDGGLQPKQECIKKLGQEPAMPKVVEYFTNNQHHVEITDGMSKRFYAACQILNSLSTINGLIKEDVRLAYEYADELLKQEKL